MKNIGPRIAALNILKDILDENKLMQDVLEKRIWEQNINMEARDKAFVKALVSTTLRRLGQIDELINHCLDKPLPEKASVAKYILRLGVAQMFFMHTPAHAAVNTSVDIAKTIGCGPYKKLVNAILRRLGREGKELVKKQDAEKTNTPEWLWNSWEKAYGKEICRKIANAHLKEAAVDISVKGPTDEWEEKLKAEKIPTGNLRFKEATGNITKLPGYKEGKWWVQGAAATLPVKLFGDVNGKTIADVCAAPGGKTAQLISLGATVSAMDSSVPRLKRLNQNLDRLEMKAKVIAADATRWNLQSAGNAPFDGVLVDAPCSSTGTIKKHPDVARLKTQKDVESLVEIQKALIESAIKMVKDNGTIIYCVCSIQPEEGPDIIEKVLTDGLPLKIEPVSAKEFPYLEKMIQKDGSIRCLPFNMDEHGGIEGFYAVRLKKV